MANKYKFYVRNEDNTAWVNILQDTNVLIDSDGSAGGQFASNLLDEVLVELKVLAGGGAPGYGGTPIHITNTDDVTDSGDDTGSFSTAGGMAVAQSLFVGGEITAETTAQFDGIATFNSSINIATDITSVQNVTGDGTGDVSGFVNLSCTGDISSDTLTLSGLATVDTLDITGTVDSNIVPTGLGTQFLGSPTNKWNTVYVGTISADTVNSTAFTGVFTGTLNGNVVGDVAGDVTGDLQGDLVKSPTVTVTSNENAVDTVSGAFVVQGGMGIAMDTFIGGNLTVQGVLDASGGLAVGWDSIPETMLPNADGAYDLGENSTPYRWRNAYFTGTVDANAVTAATLTGDLTGDVTGDLTGNLLGASNTTQGNFTVGQNLTVTGDMNVGGSISYSSLNSELGFITSINNSVRNKDEGALIVTQGGFGVELSASIGEILYVDTISSLRDDTNLSIGAHGTGIVEVADSLQVSDQSGNTVDIDVATDIAGVLTVSNATGATGSTDGALVVTGGSDIGENLYVGGTFNVTGASTFTGTLDINNAVDVDITGGDFDVLTNGTVSLVGNVATLSAVDTILTLSAPSDSIVMNSADDIGLTSSGVTITTTTGTQFVDGGVVMIQDTTTSTDTTTGALTVAGGAGIAENLNVGGDATITSATVSSDTVTGALVVTGGVGIGGNLNIGGDLDASAMTATTFTGAFVGNLNGDVTGNLVGDTVTANLGLIGDLTKATTVQVTNNTPAPTYGTGALVVANGTVGPTLGSGATFEGNVWIGGNLTLPTVGTDITLPSGRTLENELDARPVENGFVDRAESTISFDDGLMRFTIAPVATDFTFYSGGVGFTKTASETVDITDTEGLWYFYYVGDVLTASQTFTSDIITTHAFIAAVYWSVIDSAALTFAEERHGNVMSNATHGYLHNTQGSKLAGGGALGDLSTDDAVPDDGSTQFSVADFVTYDEDIRRSSTETSQVLTVPAELPVWYREWNGTLGQNVWRKQAAGTIPLIKTGTGGEDRTAWNENVGGQYQLTEITDLNFMAIHIVATNDVNEPVVAIVGQNEYADLNSAYEGGGDEAGNIEFGQIDTLSPEWVFLGTVILESDETYTNTYKARFRADVEGNDYIDLRGSTLSPSGGTTADDHAGLTNLQGGTIGSYYHSDQMINIASVPRWAGINIDWQTATDALTLTAGQRFLVPTAVSSLLLPAAPVAGQSVHLSDVDGTWGSSPVTLDNNGQNIEGVNDTLLLNVPKSSLELVFTASVGWKII